MSIPINFLFGTAPYRFRQQRWRVVARRTFRVQVPSSRSSIGIGGTKHNRSLLTYKYKDEVRHQSRLPPTALAHFATALEQQHPKHSTL